MAGGTLFHEDGMKRRVVDEEKKTVKKIAGMKKYA